MWSALFESHNIIILPRVMLPASAGSNPGWRIGNGLGHLQLIETGPRRPHPITRAEDQNPGSPAGADRGC